jgi:hypothetical protein
MTFSSYPKKIQTSSGVHPASYSIGGDTRMITYLQLVLKLSMSEAIPPLSLNAFMVCVEKITFF